MQKKLYLMQESELKGFIDCSRELREAALKMSSEEVKSHTAEILELAEINEIVEGEKISLEVDIDGIAHIPIQGMLTNHVSPSAGFFGESITTYEFLNEAIAQAQEISSVKEIVFEIASGGGEVEGVESAANAIFNSKKPTSAKVYGMAASAAFWLASQTDKIIAAGRTSSTGSIGVAAEFIDRSAQDKTDGIKRIVLTSTDAPRKRLDIKTAEGQKQTISRLDEIHTVFVDHIVRGMSARNKNITPEFVNKKFGGGTVMAADSALAVGMIDEIEGVATTQFTNAGVTAVSSTDQAQFGQQPGKAPAISTEEKMDEKQFLAFLESNPEAKAFYENQLTVNSESIATMRTEHATALTKARTEIESGKISQLDAGFILKILASSEYGESVKKCGVDVFNGENEIKMFKMVVANADETNERFKQLKIQNNQPAATGAQDHDLGTKTAAIKSTEANAKALGEDILNQSTRVQ